MVADYEIYFLRGFNMNAVGIDVSKGKSKVAVIRAYGEVVILMPSVIAKPVAAA